MSDLAAISGQVVDIQNDRQHKGSIKITMHVPAEAGPHLTSVLGWPTYTNPVPVALARLHIDKPPAKEKQAEIVPASEPEPPTRPNRYAQRAGILCNDPRFQGFMLDRYGETFLPIGPVERREWTAAKVRELCEVGSRAEILPGTPAADRLDILESAYLAENR